MLNGLKKDDEFEEDEELIYFEDLVTTCFACGHKIEGNKKICPYCQTQL